jgi:hypothetical protein
MTHHHTFLFVLVAGLLWRSFYRIAELQRNCDHLRAQEKDLIRLAGILEEEIGLMDGRIEKLGARVSELDGEYK